MESVGPFYGSKPKQTKKGQEGISVGHPGHPPAPSPGALGLCSSPGSAQQPFLESPWPYCQGKLALGLS